MKDEDIKKMFPDGIIRGKFPLCLNNFPVGKLKERIDEIVVKKIEIISKKQINTF